jgi:DNA end-binding protein Ku
VPPLHRVTLLGLVSIPIQPHTATKTNASSFNCCTQSAAPAFKPLLLPGVCNVVVERDDRVRGYEFAKDQYVHSSPIVSAVHCPGD